MKKIWCFLLAGLFVACLAACGFNGSSTSEADDLPSAANSAHHALPGGGAAPSVSENNGPLPNGDADSPLEEENTNAEHGEKTIIQQSTFYVTAGGETFSATFADNSGAQALKELLADGDITIRMSDYGGFEKVGSLGRSLPTSNSQTTTQAGDIVLYQGNQIVMFYGSNTWSYTRLARIENLTGWRDALGSGTKAARGLILICVSHRQRKSKVCFAAMAKRRTRFGLTIH